MPRRASKPDNAQAPHLGGAARPTGASPYASDEELVQMSASLEASFEEYSKEQPGITKTWKGLFADQSTTSPKGLPSPAKLTVQQVLAKGCAFSENVGDITCSELLSSFYFPERSDKTHKETEEPPKEGARDKTQKKGPPRDNVPLDLAPFCAGTVSFDGPVSKQASYIRVHDKFFFNTQLRDNEKKQRPTLQKEDQAQRAFAGVVGDDSAYAAVIAVHAQLIAQYGPNFQPPTLLISVTGGATSFQLPPHLQSLVETGLIKATKKSNAWVVTGGTHTGVMKLTGSILAQQHANTASYRPPVIGIATWGIVGPRYKNSLSDQKSLMQPGYSTKVQSKQYNDLDENHTHFLLVDDYTDTKFGGEIQFRGRFEKYASNLYDCPAVTIVVQGGPGTLDTAIASVKAKNPIVVIDGSGLVADLIAYTYHFLYSNDHRHANYSLHGLREMIVTHFPNLVQKPKDSPDGTKAGADQIARAKIEDMQNKLLKCVQIEGLVVIFSADVDDDVSFEDSILQAVFGTAGNLKNKIKQGVYFDQKEKVRQQLQLAKTSEERMEALTGGLMEALVHNKPDFVRLFLSHGANLSQLQPSTSHGLGRHDDGWAEFNQQPLFLQAVAELYQRSAQGNDSYLKKLVKAASGTAGRAKASDTSKGDLDLPSFSASKMEDLLMKPTGLRLKPRTSLVANYGFNEEAAFKRDPEAEKQATLALFIWAVSVDNFRIARELWTKCDESIPCALVASRILACLRESKALKGPHLADERQKMSKNSLKFEDLATGTLEQCYETDAKNARELLSTDVEVVQTRKGDAHDKLDVLEVATFCRSRKFISHRATQAVIEKDWRLDLNRVFKSNALIFLALFLPFIALPIRAIFYKRRSKDGKTSSRSTQDGPNYFVRLAHTITDFYTPPYIRFVQDAVSFAVLCVLFSVMVLVEYNQGEINKSTQEVFKFSLIEFLIMFWILALLVDEGGQAFGAGMRYFRNLWNWLDMINLLLYIVGISIRAIGFDDRRMQVASKTVFSFVAIGLILRGIRFYSFFEFLGPKLIMIKRMGKDVAVFVMLLMIFLLGYGVASQTLLFPLRAGDRHTLQNVLFRPYFIIYGELFLEEYDDEGGCNGSSAFTACLWKQTWIVPVLLAGYLLIANILLVNLLIAMFNDTYIQVKEEAHALWRNQYYKLLREYQTKPVLPAPLSLLISPYTLYQACTMSKRHKPFKGDLVMFQRQGATRHWEQDIKIANTDKLDQAYRAARKLKSQMRTMSNRQASLRAAFETLVVSEHQHDPSAQSGQRAAHKLKRHGGSLVEMRSGTPVQNLTTDPSDPKSGRIYGSVNQGKESDEKPTGSPAEQTTFVKLPPRFKLQDSQVHAESVEEYTPTEYTAIVPDPAGARDPILPHARLFDRDDHKSLVTAGHSAYADIRDVDRGYNLDVQGYPINPFGRTGLRGMGTLFRWGPNQAIDLLITRWRRDDTSAILRRRGKKVAEFLALKRPEGDWSLPGAFVLAGETTYEAAKRVLWTKIQRHTLEANVEKSKMYDKHVLDHTVIERLLRDQFPQAGVVEKGRAVYSCDDRNTDNAWVETTLIHIHDEAGDLTHNLKLQLGHEDYDARWAMMVDGWRLWASHAQFVKEVSEKLNCAF
eukprot:m.206413 g.206413  ORF g.206413 m.206413 type:complete len:1623 (-) comp15024_c0_seq3:196-5064(-)